MSKQIEKVLWKIEKVRAFWSSCISPFLFPSIRDMTRQSTSNFTKAEWENSQNQYMTTKYILQGKKKKKKNRT